MRRKEKNRPRFAAIFTALAVIAGIVYAVGKIPDIERNYVYPEKYSHFVEKYSAENGLDKYFVYAVIKTESNFDPQAVSEAGAVGLMQIMEDAFDWVQYRMGEECAGEEYSDLYDPETNIKYGTYLLRLLYEEYGSEETAAAAYHTGRGNVNSWLDDKSISSDGKTLENIPSSVTEHYVHKVMTAYEGYNNLYN
ncbi:MAG: lytic transglycosylase domain-containing protein [Oscillospiraceae bacterium]|nr:lytic transglycosylase domain-containing protein [Oscillospiraceae bacterium]MDD7428307.1 lytic transglycosylase domain-containing protein [Oscillospiraceae bacterium]